VCISLGRLVESVISQNNWIDISWDGERVREQKENVQLSFIETINSVIEFNTISDLVALDIANKYENLYLSLSGGCDSEFIANVFVRNNIKFTPLILVIKEFPEIESWYARRWCAQNKIEPIVLELAPQTLDDILLKYSKIIKPRMTMGLFPAYIAEYVSSLGGHLVTGNQLEYFPDQEQLSGYDSELGDYQGFIFSECDAYIETVFPDQHPWAFYYWNPDIVASFVDCYDPSITLQENKSKIYNVAIRPKCHFPGIINCINNKFLLNSRKYFGTSDLVCLGNKNELLNKLVVCA